MSNPFGSDSSSLCVNENVGMDSTDRLMGTTEVGGLKRERRNESCWRVKLEVGRLLPTLGCVDVVSVARRRE